MTRRPSLLQCEALAGLVLLLVLCPARADNTLRDEIHRQYKHHSYMLIEGPDGAWLYLFDGHTAAIRLGEPATTTPGIDQALARTRSSDARQRVRGLVELAGDADPRALDAALALLGDPNAAVRTEAEQLILDHPAGASLVATLGLEEDSELPEDADGGK